MKEIQVKVNATYEKATDSAYLYFDPIAYGEITETLTAAALTMSLKGDVNLNLDKNGKLRGIEILGASLVLPNSLLKQLKEGVKDNENNLRKSH